MDGPHETHDAERYPRFTVTIEIVILTIRDDVLAVGLARRGEWPYEGMWGLPGGLVRADLDSSLDRAAQRELIEETFLKLYPHASPGYARHLHLEQLKTYWGPGRDPRPGLQVATVAYLAVAPHLPALVAAGDAAAVRWIPVEDVLDERVALAFDHSRIVADGVERARAKLEYTALATALVPPEFTVAELRRVYEIVWGVPLDKRNFHRKATHRDGFLEPTGRTTTRGRGRPAQLYRHNGHEAVHHLSVHPHHRP